MNQIGLIIILVSVSGLAGGIGNFFRFESNSEFQVFNFGKSVFQGLIAAFTVPLFLNMVSSDLMQFKDTPVDYFVFIGFCLVASFFSNRFMTSVGDRIVQDLEKVKRKTDVIEEETKENSERVEVLMDEQTDGGSIATGQINLEELGNDIPSELVEKIINSFKNEKFKFRTVEGISRESGLDDNKTKDLIEKLEQKEIVKRYRGRGGKRIYSLTD